MRGFGCSVWPPKRGYWRRERPSSFRLRPVTAEGLLVDAFEFRDALVRVNLDGEGDTRADQDALRCLLGHDLAGVCQAEFVPHFLGQRQRAALVDVNNLGHGF